MELSLLSAVYQVVIPIYPSGLGIGKEQLIAITLINVFSHRYSKANIQAEVRLLSCNVRLLVLLKVRHRSLCHAWELSVSQVEG